MFGDLNVWTLLHVCGGLQKFLLCYMGNGCYSCIVVFMYGLCVSSLTLPPSSPPSLPPLSSLPLSSLSLR